MEKGNRQAVKGKRRMERGERHESKGKTKRREKDKG